MVSKQVMLGVALIIGGSVAFFALAKNDSAADAAAQAAAKDTTTTKVAKPVVQPLTADVATEERLIAQKQRAREAHNLQMQKQAAALLEEQNNARKQALDKANAEATGRPLSNTQEVSADSAAKSELIAAPTVQTRPEAIEAARKAEEAKKAEEAAKKAEQQKSQTKKSEDKSAEDKKSDDKKSETKSEAKEVKAPAKAGTYEVQAGESWQGISNRHGVSVAALTEANGMTRSDVLRAGRSIKIPSASQVARLERDNKAREAKAKQEAAKSEASKSSDTTKNKSTEKSDTKKSDTKTETKSQNPQMSGRYTVQVAISPDKEKVDEIVKQYRAAGYRVTTSSTSRGLRVLVGNEKSEEGAKALRKKIADDSRVSAPGAFVHQVQ